MSKEKQETKVRDKKRREKKRNICYEENRKSVRKLMKVTWIFHIFIHLEQQR